ncbi:MAG: signal peptidase I [candidate division WS1 bacterium]|nr:signal peptidase I [candidate division WS1 bacterium]
MNGAQTMLAFENPWHIVALVGAIIAIRVAVPRIQMSRATRATILEFVDSGLVAALLVFCLLRPFVIQAFFIPSGSMEPTLQEGDRILVTKFTYFFRDPVPGDIVVFNAPPAASIDDKDFIKRVVGAPGDELCVRDGALYRDEERIEEDYIAEEPRYIWPEPGQCVSIPERQYVVMGDNRNDSNDSHKWGYWDPTTGRWNAQPYLPRENVLGKAVLIFWPPQRMRLLH